MKKALAGHAEIQMVNIPIMNLILKKEQGNFYRISFGGHVAEDAGKGKVLRSRIRSSLAAMVVVHATAPLLMLLKKRLVHFS